MFFLPFSTQLNIIRGLPFLIDTFMFEKPITYQS